MSRRQRFLAQSGWTLLVHRWTHDRACQSLRFLEHVVWDRYRRLHTRSITAGSSRSSIPS